MRGPNVSGILFSQGSRMVKVRSSQGATVAGRWVETPNSDREIRAVVRPISPSDRQLMPEGMRTEDSTVFLTRPNVTLVVEQNQANGGVGADRILNDGFWWRVVGEKPWVSNGFRRYVAIREDKGKERGR